MSEAATAEAGAAQSTGAEQSAAATQQAAPTGGFLGGEQAAAATTQSTGPRPIFGEHVNADGKFNEGWTDTIREAGFETLAGKLQTAKDQAGALSILDNAIKTASRKELKGRPNETWGDSDVAEFRRAMDIPDDPAAYQIKPENLPAGLQWDDTEASEFASILHGEHASAGLAKKLGELHAKKMEKIQASAHETFEGRINELAAESSKVFAKEWGDEADDRRTANSDFVKAQGFDTKDPIIRAALSHPSIVRLVDQARRSLREAPLPSGEVFTGSQSPRQQAQELMKTPAYRTDPAVQKRVADLYSLDAAQSKRKTGR